MVDFDDHDPNIEEELQQVRGALLDDTIATLGPAAPGKQIRTVRLRLPPQS